MTLLRHDIVSVSVFVGPAPPLCLELGEPCSPNSTVPALSPPSPPSYAHLGPQNRSKSSVLRGPCSQLEAGSMGEYAFLLNSTARRIPSVSACRYLAPVDCNHRLRLLKMCSHSSLGLVREASRAHAIVLCVFRPMGVLLECKAWTLPFSFLSSFAFKSR